MNVYHLRQLCLTLAWMLGSLWILPAVDLVLQGMDSSPVFEQIAYAKKKKKKVKSKVKKRRKKKMKTSSKSSSASSQSSSQSSGRSSSASGKSPQAASGKDKQNSPDKKEKKKKDRKVAALTNKEGKRMLAKILPASIRIQGLKYRKKKIRIRVDRDPGKFKPFIVFRGRYKGSPISFLQKDRNTVLVDAKKREKPYRLRFKIPLSGRVTKYKLYAVNARGQIRTEELNIVFDEYDNLKNQHKDKKRWSLSAGFGPTIIRYSQTKASSYSAISLTGKMSFRFGLTQNVDLGLSTFANLVTVSENIEGAEARFVGINGRIGYAFGFPLRLSINGGIYYLSMFTNTTQFGFDTVIGPQLYPFLSYSFAGGSMWWMYGKFSPVTNNFSILNLSNREVATGTGINIPLTKAVRMNFSVNASNLQLEIQGVSINSTTLSVDAGIGF